MKRFLCVTLFCALLLASQFGCANSKQPKAVAEKNVPSANAVAASPEIEDLNRLISKLTYYRSPRNLQDPKPQSIEEIKATFGKQEPDVDPVIEGIYKELLDKYKNDQEFLLALNHVFLKYLFMIEDEKRFTALINQMPADYVFNASLTYKGQSIELKNCSLNSGVFSKNELVGILKKIKSIDTDIQNSIGSYDKLIKLFSGSEDPYALVGNLFAMQSVSPACGGGEADGDGESVQFGRRIDQFHELLLDAVKDDSESSRLEQILEKVSVAGIGSPITAQEFSEADYQRLAKLVIDARYQKIKSLKSEFGIAATNGVPGQSSIFKVSKLFYLIDLDWIRTEGAVKGYLLIKKSGREFLPILYIEKRFPVC